MPGIYITAIITTVLSLGIIGSFILRDSAKRERLFLIAVILLEIPMCAFAFYFIRLPLDAWLRGVLSGFEQSYRFLTTLYAPLTEELVKLWIILFPWFSNKINNKTIMLKAAMAIGLGFGIGEMWLVAYELTKRPEIALLPWYSFGGYLNERFMVCILHGAFTAAALRRMRSGFFWGILAAMFLHFMGNFPIYLAGTNFAGLGKPVWQIILSLWVSFYFLVMTGLLIYLAWGKFQGLSVFIYGRAKCPECGLIYPRPLFAVNMVTKRYERCPGCKKYHWTEKWVEV